jgi:hypothetical protein
MHCLQALFAVSVDPSICSTSLPSSPSKRTTLACEYENHSPNLSLPSSAPTTNEFQQYERVLRNKEEELRRVSARAREEEVRAMSLKKKEEGVWDLFVLFVLFCSIGLLSLSLSPFYLHNYSLLLSSVISDNNRSVCEIDIIIRRVATSVDSRDREMEENRQRSPPGDRQEREKLSASHHSC